LPTSHALDAYLETIYILASEGITVIGARVADMMAVRAPSVTEAMQRLETRELVTVDEVIGQAEGAGFELRDAESLRIVDINPAGRALAAKLTIASKADAISHNFIAGPLKEKFEAQAKRILEREERKK